MAFDPSKYKVTEARKLPVLLLLDVSASMHGENIDALNDATVEMIKDFTNEGIREVSIDIAMITFGTNVLLHKNITFAPAKQWLAEGWTPLLTGGATPLGTALNMAYDLLEDKEILPKNIYKPIVVLVSDGEPNDSWEGSLKKFVSEGRSSKCQRFAVGIGNGYKRSVLEAFTSISANVLEADNAKDIAKHFKFISTTVSKRATSNNPNQTQPDSNSKPTQLTSNINNDIIVDDDDDDGLI